VKYASVVIDAVLDGGDDKIFDYIIPDGMTIEVGCRVLVEFGKTTTEGFVLAVKDETSVPKDKLKKVSRALDDFIAIKPEFLKTLDCIANQFKLRKIDVLRLFVPSVMRGGKASAKTNLFVVNPYTAEQTQENILKINPRAVKQREFLATFIDTRERRLADIREVSIQVVDALIEAGYLQKTEKAVRRAPNALVAKAQAKITLTTQQQAAVDSIMGGNMQTFVLHGVTGSGKTEVYMNVIERMLEMGKTAIMLVPEIGLTPQVLSSFRARFGEVVAILHSGLSTGERYDEWLRLHRGQAKIAIGARSAVFAPLESLGIIIIDEEHDGSYFAESNPRFHTHEIAKTRANYNNCNLVLGSATPSIETFHKTTTSEYKLLTLDRRVKNLQMPTIQLVDMVAELRSGNGGYFSRDMLSKIQTTVDSGNQAIIFLNRRGYHSAVSCRGCGWTAKCENCDVSLVWHKEDGQLKCHYCGGRWTSVTRCPSCSATTLKMGATGTQKVVEELGRLFPNVPVFRMDADNTQTKDALIGILEKFGNTSPSILVGTQMIAKGHHFPRVSLVGIIDADNALHFSDFRATERTFNLITQVAGRAGRDTGLGEVLVQTLIPTHYVYRLAANYDYAKFFERELNIRQTTKYPPFTTIVRVLVTGTLDTAIKDCIAQIMTTLRTRDRDFIFLGAMKSPLGRLQNKFRYQILARINREGEGEMLDFIDCAVKSATRPRNTQIFLEINPQNLS
jgi:primosomal protein N' (replication factor Y)